MQTPGKNFSELLNDEAEFRDGVHKKCLLCMGRSRLYTNKFINNPEKQSVQNALHGLYTTYNSMYDALRKTNANENRILLASANKRIILDEIDECKNCNREVDRANRALLQLK